MTGCLEIFRPPASCATLSSEALRRAGLNRFPGLGDPGGVNASVEARTRCASRNKIRMRPSHEKRHMVPQFGIRGVPVCAKRPVIVCILAEENLFDEKAGRVLQNCLRMIRKRGRLSQGVNVTDSNL